MASGLAVVMSYQASNDSTFEVLDPSSIVMLLGSRTSLLVPVVHAHAHVLRLFIHASVEGTPNGVPSIDAP